MLFIQIGWSFFLFQNFGVGCLLSYNVGRDTHKHKLFPIDSWSNKSALQLYVVFYVKLRKKANLFEGHLFIEYQTYNSNDDDDDNELNATIIINGNKLLLALPIGVVAAIYDSNNNLGNNNIQHLKNVSGSCSQSTCNI